MPILKNKLSSVYKMAKVLCFFVIYFLLGVVDITFSFAQDYVPIQRNERTDVRERRVARYNSHRPKGPSDLERLEQKEKISLDSLKEARDWAMYDVAASSKKDQAKEKIIDEKINRRNEIIGMYGVAAPRLMKIKPEVEKQIDTDDDTENNAPVDLKENEDLEIK